MSKTTDELVAELQQLLAERLPLSRSWNNVALKDKIGRFEDRYKIKWFDSKKYDDPDGEYSFSSHGGPFTIEGLEEEIESQKKKLKEDKANAT